VIDFSQQTYELFFFTQLVVVVVVVVKAMFLQLTTVTSVLEKSRMLWQKVRQLVIAE